MLPYLHFQGGDFLLFKAWVPRSSGAIAGACIGLVALAILERFITAWRARLEDMWAVRCVLTSHISCLLLKIVLRTHELMSHVSTENVSTVDDEKDDKVPAATSTSITSTMTSPPQLIPPFILSHDLSRGAVYALQSLLGYALMLAVMTYNAAYIISLLAGLGIGEVIFGRWKGLGAHAAVH
ncbi:Ctr copper transporter [Schizophyllum amplum]|uniref:Copper transport protein n=1 Tax=Schizophyllum amplum TaxID=97359 RepID=A0A550C9R5_9AGAR|nr:Ctr copper transporter [Auriculariopsis ampla]